MLPRPLVEEVDRLLKDGTLSHRKIAARLGVSRGTVGAIASGRRGLFGRDPKLQNADPLVPLSPPKRCQACGFKVYEPCLVCSAREYRERRKRARAVGADRGGLAARSAVDAVRLFPVPTPSHARVA